MHADRRVKGVVAKASYIERVRSGLYTGLAPKTRSRDITSYHSRGSCKGEGGVSVNLA
jgi:hypothetical protein